MGKYILLCDDEIHILRAAEFKLARAGYEVECVGDGFQGWEAVERRRPDLLITDCQMPRLGGLGLIERIRKHEEYCDLPIMLLTAKGFELSERELVERWQVLDIINKPFSPRDLLRRVDHVLGSATTEFVPSNS